MTTSFATLKSSPHAVSFPVNEVEPANQLLKEIKYQQAVELLLGRVEACSVKGKNLVELDKCANVFMETLYIAFKQHRPLILSPDHIWLLICQGVAKHIQQHAEALRDKLVSFQGKKILTVNRRDFIEGDPNNPWEEVFPEFSQQIRAHVGNEIHDFFTTRFSTTGIVEQNAFEITLMDAMKLYFTYEMNLICGIPQITLEGTPSDWQIMLEKIELLRRFELGWWVDQLIPILRQFVQASQGKIDKAFWQAIYIYTDNRDCEPIDEKKPSFFRITGWCTKLFPYLTEEAEGEPHFYSSYHIKAGTINRFFRNPFIESPLMEVKNYNQGVSPYTLPSGVSAVHVKYQYGEKQGTKNFFGGFLGISQHQATMAIRPEIGWAIVGKKSSQ